MRENRPYGSEGGVATGDPYPYRRAGQSTRVATGCGVIRPKEAYYALHPDF